MTRVEQHLAKYGSYHQDRRNVATHFLGIPLIVLGIAILLSRAALTIGPASVSVAGMLVSVLTVYYLWLELRLGLALAVFLWGAVAVGHVAALQSTWIWLLLGTGGFVVGWALQFLGHVWEGRKPAFLDDLRSLLIGPLFVAAECAFALGLMQALRSKIHQRDCAG